MSRPFLTARWSNLCLFTYAVPPDLLRPRVPPGLEIDLRDGQAFVSLVAFDFLETRVMGVSWPGYRNFPEINLRFYLRRGTERGVMFVREFVPARLVAWTARTLYNEPYLATPMRSRVTDSADEIRVEHELDFAGRTQRVQLAAAKPAFMPGPESTEHFFKEHQWGYGVTMNGQALRYEVRHPHWDVYTVRSHAVDFDFAAVYGQEWKLLHGREPYSVVLAAGSPVEVYPKGRPLTALEEPSAHGSGHP